MEFLTSPLNLLAEGSNFLQAELVFVALLTIAAIVAVFSRIAQGVPYTVALLLAGLVLTFLPSDFFTVGGELGDIILFILVPPLIFEATLHVKWKALRQDLLPILLLAGLGSLIGALLVALPIAQMPGISFVAAFTFGTLISATDPVAVIAFFRSLGVSKRLALLVEGESLFNDGVAIVLFSVAVGIAGAGGVETFELSDALITFARVAGGGLLIGIVLGYAVANVVLRYVDDHLIETAWTVALAFGSFALAEHFHLSGILAVVAAGIIAGNWGTENTSPTTQITLDNFWEFLAFIANSFVFLLIGLETEIQELIHHLPQILLAVVVVLVARAIVVYVITFIVNKINGERAIPMTYQHIMWWGGLHGAISLALVLSLVSAEGYLPEEIRTLIIMTYGVVLFTLLVQATTLPKLLRTLKLTTKPEQMIEQQRRQAHLVAKRAGKEALARLYREGILAKEVWEAMDHIYSQQITQDNQALIKHLQTFAELKLGMVLQARAEAIKAERDAIGQALRRGLISEEVHGELIREIDNRAVSLDIIRQRSGV